MYAHTDIYTRIYTYIRHTRRHTPLYMYLYIFIDVCKSLLFAYVCVCLYAYPLCVCLSLLCLSFYPSICLSVTLSVCPWPSPSPTQLWASRLSSHIERWFVDVGCFGFGFVKFVLIRCNFGHQWLVDMFVSFGCVECWIYKSTNQGVIKIRMFSHKKTTF